MIALRLLIVAAVAYLLFFHGLGGITLWDPDEPRQAVVAREMVARGDFLHPYLNGVPYLEKPPFHPWLVAFSAWLSGRLDEFSARLPSAIAGTLLLFLVYLLGARLADEAAGLLSALICATNFQVISAARLAVMDMTFAFLIGLTIGLGYLALEREKRFMFFLALLPSALAILTKGPAGLALPACVLFILMLVRRQARDFMLPLVEGCLVSVALASVWFLLVGGQYVSEFLVRQNIVRYTTGFDHVESWWYYGPKLLVNFLPWSLFLPFALFYCFRRKQLLPLVWLLVILAFFEFSRSKRAVYLLPLYPAASLAVGIYLRERWEELVRGRARWLILPCGALVAAAPLLATLNPGALGRYRELLTVDGLQLTVLIMLLVILAGLFMLAVARREPGSAVIAMLAYLSVCGFAYHAIYQPFADRASKSPMILVDSFSPVKPQTAVFTYGFDSPGLIYYVGRPVPSLKEPREAARFQDVVVVSVQKKGEAAKTFPFLSVQKEVNYEKQSYTILVKKHEG